MNASLNQAIKLCRATGVTLDYIYMDKRETLPRQIAEAIIRAEKERLVKNIRGTKFNDSSMFLVRVHAMFCQPIPSH